MVLETTIWVLGVKWFFKCGRYGHIWLREKSSSGEEREIRKENEITDEANNWNYD